MSRHSMAVATPCGASARDRLPALTRAGVAHFYFVCIHPFEDGNGRIGRAPAEKVLARSLGEPSLIGAVEDDCPAPPSLP